MTWTPPERTNTNYIRTLSGKKFWPLNPRPEDVDITDIANALSLMCRYNGHLPYLYSVGQHSLNVYYRSEKNIWGLLHDATEAYLPDVPKPIKAQMPYFTEIEWRLHTVIAEALGLDPELVHVVKQADTDVLLAEYGRFRPGSVYDDQVPLIRDVNSILNYVEPKFIAARFLYEYQRSMKCLSS